MVHSGCQHIVLPHSVATAPPSIGEADILAQCLRCRGEGEMAVILQAERDRLQAAESALRGMKLHLPRFFGVQTTSSFSNIDERIAELRKDFAAFFERVWRVYEDEEREKRQRW